jgi:hypothetical protein
MLPGDQERLSVASRYNQLAPSTYTDDLSGISNFQIIFRSFGSLGAIEEGISGKVVVYSQ